GALRSRVRRGGAGDGCALRDGDLRQRTEPLREETLARVARRKLWRGGKFGKATQDDFRGGARVAVRQAPDAGRETGNEQRRTCGGHRRCALSISMASYYTESEGARPESDHRATRATERLWRGPLLVVC